jgi:hypothetical protein
MKVSIVSETHKHLHTIDSKKPYHFQIGDSFIYQDNFYQIIGKVWSQDGNLILIVTPINMAQTLREFLK